MNTLKSKIYKINTGHHIVCFIDPSQGKRRRKKFSSLAKAKTYQKDLEIQFKTKGAQSFSQVPVAKLLDRHLEQFPSSRVTERKGVFLSFCYEMGHRPISSVGKTELQAWFEKIKEENDYSDRTLNAIKSQLNAFFGYLKDEDIIRFNPLSEIKFKRKPPMRRPRIVLSAEEVKELLENAQKFSPTYLYPYLYTIANTGARRSEIQKLKREDIDFETGLIHLRKTKNGEDRSIRMSQKLYDLLEAHLKIHQSNFVFCNPEGRQLGKEQLSRLIRKFKRHFPTAKEWSLHGLRHSFAFNFLKKGGEMYQLQAILGHKGVGVTVDLYGQLSAQDIENPSPYED